MAKLVLTTDIETVDSSLNGSLQIVISYAASLVGAVVVVAFIVPWFLVPAAIIAYLYWQYSVLYLRVGRSLRRLEATLKSPILCVNSYPLAKSRTKRQLGLWRTARRRRVCPSVLGGGKVHDAIV